MGCYAWRIGTYYRYKDLQLSSIRYLQGLPDNNVRSIIEDDAGPNLVKYE